jgi:hypothetical protein
MINKLGMFLITSIFFLNIGLVMADHEKTIPYPETQFYLENISPACKFYDNIGLKPIDADCSQWYMTHEGNKLTLEYMLKH